MDYYRIYSQIIEKRKAQAPIGYVEEHHIIPKSLGGDDSKENLVKLTAREHFICHLLLTKIYVKGSNEYYKMCHAFLMMFVNSKNQERHINSNKYEILRKEFSKNISYQQSGLGNSQYGTKWIYNPKLQITKKIKLNDIIEDGWKIGRIIDWNLYFSKIEHKQSIKAKKEKSDNLKTKLSERDKLEENISRYTEYFEIYDTVGFKEFVRITGYSKSQPALVKAFAKYVVKFTPQNGKQRGKIIPSGLAW